MNKKRAYICLFGGIILIVFYVTLVACLAFFVPGYFGAYSFAGNLLEDTEFWLVPTIIISVTLFVIFWVGIILVYVSSTQLGIRYRVLGIVFGMVPIANLIMLSIIIRTVFKEVRYELKKEKVNEERADEQICATKYPILMVHGVLFRDSNILNYWGRIPRELERNGAKLFYGLHNSASSVEDSAKQLEARILEIINKTGCEKINVIAHSKGGLDMRTAISTTSIAPYIASLTTINTPHRGCEFADYLLYKIPESKKNQIATAYNTMAAKLGDDEPDFLAAMYDLTSTVCAKRNERIFDVPGVYYQSVGSKLNRPTSGRFPLNMTYHLVKHFDGPNDGLVGYKSFPWGSDFRFLTVKGKRGLSHGDMIDLNRENIYEFDVREFYVNLVKGLKEKGF